MEKVRSLPHCPANRADAPSLAARGSMPRPGIYKQRKAGYKFMGIIRRFFNQTRRPTGVLGRLMLYGMNAGHRKLADWGMTCLPAVSPEHILELGCGGGRNIAALLLKYPRAHVLGVDYSLTSVKQASAFNRSSIQAGRCSVRIGDISTLRLSPETYDLATAFETVYFWPDLVQCFKNIFNGLKPGGIFLIVNESDGTDVAGLKYEKIIDGMKVYSAPLLEHALKDAGFTTVKSFHRAEKPWIAVLAEK